VTRRVEALAQAVSERQWAVGVHRRRFRRAQTSGKGYQPRSKNQALELAAVSKFWRGLKWKMRIDWRAPTRREGRRINRAGLRQLSRTVEEEQSGCLGIAMESARRRPQCRRKCRRIKAAYGTEKHARLVTL